MYTCDTCGKVCRSGDAFCSNKCAEAWDDESTSLWYNQRSDKSPDHTFDSGRWAKPQAMKSGAD